MKWANTKIDVLTQDGNRTVMAKCKGEFAIHDFITGNGNTFGKKTLTHIPTGMAIIYQSTTGALYRAVKKLEQLDFSNVNTGEKPPETFDLETFRTIQREHTHI